MVSCPACGELIILDEPEEAPAISSGQVDPELDRPPMSYGNKDETVFPHNDEVEFEFVERGQPLPDPEARPPSPAAEEPWPTQDPNEPGLDEIADYGNSEISQANDGLLLFDVLVDGIDTNELRNAVKDVLKDKRFLWNADGLMASIRNGKLRVDKISSIKASLLVRRLKSLDLKIKWEQYAITQAGLE